MFDIDTLLNIVSNALSILMIIKMFKSYNLTFQHKDDIVFIYIKYQYLNQT